MPSISLIGPPGSGVSTVFELLGGSPSRAPLRVGFSADRAVVPVADPRFERLCDLFSPRKRTPVTIEIVDIPGFDTRTDAKLRTAALSEIRRTDAYAIVLDLFRPEARESPEAALAALRAMSDEMVFADYATVERGIENVEGAARAKHDPEAERRHTFLLGLLPALERGEGLRGTHLDEEGERRVRQYGLLTRRPVLVIANLAEDDLADSARLPAVRALREHCDARGWHLFCLSAQVEREIKDLDPADRPALLAAFHLSEPGLHRFVRHAYAALDLITFFTVGEDEVRGWTVRRHTPAKRAAGAIHSDLERGFIRAEVIQESVLLECGSLAEARRRGVLRVEGKDYPVQDGDIFHVRFSV